VHRNPELTYTESAKDLEKRVLSFLREPNAGEFEQLAFQAFSFQRRHNEPFARYCDYLRTEPSTWRDLPAVPQQAFKSAELRTNDKTSFEFRTSGTTGEGYGRHLLPSLTLYEAAVRAGWNFFGLPNTGFFLLMPSPQHMPFSSLSRMGSILCGDNSNAFYVGPKGELEADRLAADLSNLSQPVVIFGPALAFLNLVEQSDWRVQLPSDSLLMETGGFKGSGREIAKSQLYSTLSERFGVPAHAIWNEYGMTELSSQLYASGREGLHRPPPWVRFLVIEPVTEREAAPGQPGRLRLVDLANLWSVLAVQTEDLAIAQDDECFLLLGRDPAALPRGCSRAIDELINLAD
jgi:acyl-coenzyme A synthetase/AMP-(fatty) acid ligase